MFPDQLFELIPMVIFFCPKTQKILTKNTFFRPKKVEILKIAKIGLQRFSGVLNPMAGFISLINVVLGSLGGVFDEKSKMSKNRNLAVFRHFGRFCVCLTSVIVLSRALSRGGVHICHRKPMSVASVSLLALRSQAPMVYFF